MASLEQTFAIAATLTVEVRRPPLLSGTPPKRGTPTVVLAASKCTPFYPVSPDTAARAPLDAPHTLRQTFTLDAWQQGDTVWLGGVKAYTVVTVADWPWPRGGYVVSDVVVRQDET